MMPKTGNGTWKIEDDPSAHVDIIRHRAMGPRKIGRSWRRAAKNAAQSCENKMFWDTQNRRFPFKHIYIYIDIIHI